MELVRLPCSATATATATATALPHISFGTTTSFPRAPASVRWPEWHRQSSVLLHLRSRGQGIVVVRSLGSEQGSERRESIPERDPISEEGEEEEEDGLGDGGSGSDEGLVEELESLEEEAITGQDEGRKPTDYDRRAQIFYESSRVFQELKDTAADGGGDGKE